MHDKRTLDINCSNGTYNKQIEEIAMLRNQILIMNEQNLLFLDILENNIWKKIEIDQGLQNVVIFSKLSFP